MPRRELLLVAVPAVVALGGGVLAALWHPSHRARSLIQHFAAGVVLAALAVELLPEIEREHAPGLVLGGSFAAGALFMFLLKLGTERLESRPRPSPGTKAGVPMGLLVAVFVDVAVDGFIIGAGFAAGGETGPVLAIGLSVELLFLGLALTSEALVGWRIIALSGAVGLTVLGAALVGKVVLAGASHSVLGGTLAAAAAALLYLVTEELLVEAHEGDEPETPWATLVLFAGFLAFWSVQLAGRDVGKPPSALETKHLTPVGGARERALDLRVAGAASEVQVELGHQRVGDRRQRVLPSQQVVDAELEVREEVPGD